MSWRNDDVVWLAVEATGNGSVPFRSTNYPVISLKLLTRINRTAGTIIVVAKRGF